MIKVGVLGARGRMGAMVCDAVRAAGDMELSATVDKGDPREPLAGCDAVVDFTHPGAVMENLRWCLSRGLPTLAGASGFADRGEPAGQAPPQVLHDGAGMENLRWCLSRGLT